jgi:hypothetical protein
LVVRSRLTDMQAHRQTCTQGFVHSLAHPQGLAATLLLLSILQHALPALPISIALGLAFYFSTSDLLSPFLDNLSVSQVFI